MIYFRKALQKVFFWNYPRSSWQWDALCVVILMFIFVTPKSWFQGSERPSDLLHPKPMSTVLLGPEMIANEGDKQQIESRVRRYTGRNDAEIIAVRRIQDDTGNIRAYEVDIR